MGANEVFFNSECSFSFYFYYCYFYIYFNQFHTTFLILISKPRLVRPLPSHSSPRLKLSDSRVHSKHESSPVYYLRNSHHKPTHTTLPPPKNRLPKLRIHFYIRLVYNNDISELQTHKIHHCSKMGFPNIKGILTLSTSQNTLP